MAEAFGDAQGQKAHVLPLQLTYEETPEGEGNKDVQVVTTHELKEIPLKDQVDTGAGGGSLKSVGSGKGSNSSVKEVKQSSPQVEQLEAINKPYFGPSLEGQLLERVDRRALFTNAKAQAHDRLKGWLNELFCVPSYILFTFDIPSYLDDFFVSVGLCQLDDVLGGK